MCASTAPHAKSKSKRYKWDEIPVFSVSPSITFKPTLAKWTYRDLRRYLFEESRKYKIGTRCLMCASSRIARWIDACGRIKSSTPFTPRFSPSTSTSHNYLLLSKSYGTPSMGVKVSVSVGIALLPNVISRILWAACLSPTTITSKNQCLCFWCACLVELCKSK